MSSAFDVLLLDLNGTFMFENDRFGVRENYGRTYREAGGTTLSDGEVAAAVSELVEKLTTVGRDTERFDSFPSVWDCLRQLPPTQGWSDAELRRVEHVVAAHEIGRIPEPYANFVSALGEDHRLGLVSNLWSRKGPWLAELERVGLTGIFHWLIFSSDGPSVKPSPRIFQPVFDDWKGPRERMLMIGDSLRRDVAGACNVGIKSLWISHGEPRSREWPSPDYRVADLLEASELPRSMVPPVEEEPSR